MKKEILSPSLSSEALLISIHKRAGIILMLPIAGDKTRAIPCPLMMLVSYRSQASSLLHWQHLRLDILAESEHNGHSDFDCDYGCLTRVLRPRAGIFRWARQEIRS